MKVYFKSVLSRIETQTGVFNDCKQRKLSFLNLFLFHPETKLQTQELKLKAAERDGVTLKSTSGLHYQLQQIQNEVL